MTELIFLGTGAIRPATPGDHTAMLLRHSDVNLLLDAGPAVLMQLHRAGIDPVAITHVYFSHQHGDHIVGSVVLPFYHGHRTLIAAAPVLEAWRQLMHVVYPGLLAMLEPEITYHPLPCDHAHPCPSLPGVTVRLALAHHGNVPAYAIRLDFPPVAKEGWRAGFSLVYSGDTTPSEAVAELAAGADLLIHEATYLESYGDDVSEVHTSARAAGVIAQAAGVTCLALVHRSAGDPADWRKEAAATFSGSILTPLAGDRLSLPDDLPVDSRGSR
jgi:ribonuclease Z